MIPQKSEAELAIMRQAGHMLARIMDEVKKNVSPGIETIEIDGLAERLIREQGAVPAFKGYKGYPATICVSINEEVVHGIPGKRRLKEGDIASLDLGLKYKDFYSDIAVTVPVGKIDIRAKRLIEITKDSLNEGLKKARSGNKLQDVSYAIQAYVEKNGCSVVRQFVGHGIGTELHEEPEVPNFGRPDRGPVLKSGMVLAIEPMVNLGGWECEILQDGWTAIAKDRSLSAHFEHTIAITDKGAEILTRI